MISLRPQKVSPLVAMNPVARALARQRLQKSMVDIKIKLYMTDDGEQIQSVVQEISRLIVVTMLACKIDRVKDHIQLMDEALKALCTIAENQFRWDKSVSELVDNALDGVLLNTPKLSAVALFEATKEIAKLEAEEKLRG